MSKYHPKVPPRRAAPAPRAKAGAKIGAKTGAVAVPDLVKRATALAAAGNKLEAANVMEAVAARRTGLLAAIALTQAANYCQRSEPERADALLQRALQADPDCASAWRFKAVLLDRVGERQQALEAASKVLTLKASPEDKLVAANLLSRLGSQRQALQASVEAFDALGRPIGHAANLLYIALRAADWALCQRLIEQFEQTYLLGEADCFVKGRETPRTHVLWCADEVTNMGVLKQWSLHAFPIIAANQMLRPEPLENRRLRVAYLSSDFRDHPTAWLVNGLFRNHDLSQVELFAYCCSWDDGSAIRKQVLSRFEHVHCVTHLSDQQAAQLIRSHQIDVLVDLNGATRGNRLDILALRAAPVQISYLGFPGSAGGRFIDYIIGDSHTVPDAVCKLYPEKLIRITSTYAINDYAARVRPPMPSKKALGLPENVPILGVFNAINKVRQEVWSVWMEIMRNCPAAVLWVLEPGELARENLLRATAAAQVNPRRILFAPYARQDDHIARMQCCDLMLDPWPYGGHTTTVDALFAGVPVLALEGSNFASRVNGGLLRAARLDGLVCPSTQSYVQTAVKLIQDPAKLAHAKAFIRDKIDKTDVFNALSKTRQLESAYRVALEQSLAGQSFRNISFAPPSGTPPKPGRKVPAKQGPEFKIIKNPSTKSSGVTIFAVVRNEIYFLPHFLRHYRNLGVQEFWFLDDNSTDGTRDFLRAQSDCGILGSNMSFGDKVGHERFGIAVKTLVPRGLLLRRWVLTVDADEFLLLPPPFKTLDALAAAMGAAGLQAARALMLDFFPASLQTLANATMQSSPFQLCPFFDAFEHVDWPDCTMQPRTISLGDAVRPRMLRKLSQLSSKMRDLLQNYRPANANKVPLLFWQSDTKMLSAHRASVSPSNKIQLVLAHFKFYPGYKDRIADALDTNAYWQNSIEYRFLDLATRELQAWPLKGTRTRLYQSEADLVKAGLLFSQIAPTNDAKKHDACA